MYWWGDRVDTGQYTYEPDRKTVTGTLVASGYRPYMLSNDDIGTVQVWAKDVAAVQRYARGEVAPFSMYQGMRIDRTAVIVLDQADSGLINDSRVVKPGESRVWSSD
jgi:hypothetical protein